MNEPVPPPEEPDVLVGPAPEPPPASGGLAWGLVASAAGHVGIVLALTVGRCGAGWVTEDVAADADVSERAFVVFSIDSGAFARLQREAADAAALADEVAPPDAQVLPPDAAVLSRDPRRLPPEPRLLPPDPQALLPADAPADAQDVPPDPRLVPPDPRLVALDPRLFPPVPDGAAPRPPPDAPPSERPPTSEPPDALALAERRDEPVPERPEPEPPPEEEPLIEPAEYLRFLDVDDLTEPAEDVVDAEYIGARDALPDHTSKAPVTADLAGPRRATSPTTAVLPSAARAEVRVGDPLAAPEARTEVETEASAGRLAPAEGGPRGASSEGSGAPGEGGDGWEGGSAAARSVASPGSVAIPATAGSAAPSVATASVPAALPTDPGDAVLVDPLGTDRLGASEDPAEASQPVAARAGSSASAPSREETSDGDGVAMAARPGDASDRGGSGGLADERASAEGGTPGQGSTVGEGEARANDPVADLRDALGWGDVDREAMPASTGRAGSPGSVGSPASSPQGVVLDEIEIGDVSWARVTDDPRGRYSDSVYDIVRARWHERDLDQDSKALGVQGRVTVVFRVYRNGDVSTPEIVRRSGHDVLDRLALSSVPDRLPRLPRDLEGASLLLKVNFTYRNPLIATEPP